MDNDEKRKLKAMLKEKDKDGTPLQWMYKESKPDDEDFLLGKRIDKVGGGEEEAKEDTYGALFNERIQHNIQMDAAAKMREDPLFAIKKKEEDAKRRLLENPVKMKRLQKAIERQKQTQEKKSKKKKRKGDDSDSDSADDLMSKYLNILNEKRKGGRGDKADVERKQRDRDRSPYRKETPHTEHNQRETRNYEREATRDNFNYRDSGQQERERNYGRDKGREFDREMRGNYRGRNNRGFDRNRNMNRGRQQDQYYGSGRNYESRRSPDDRYVPNRGRDLHESRDRYKRVDKGGYRDSDSDDYSSAKHKSIKMKPKYSQRSNLDSSSDRNMSRSSRTRRDNFVRKNVKKERRDSSSSSDSESENDIRKNVSKRDSEVKSAVNKGKYDNSSSECSDDNGHRKSSKNKQFRNENTVGRRQVSSSGSDSEDSRKAAKSRKYDSDSDTERKPKPKSYGLVILNPDSAPRSRSSQRQQSSRSSSPPKRSAAKRKSKSRSPPRQPKRKLTSEEKQRRLEEMMENAKWREEQRETNVKRYAKEEKKEIDDYAKNFETTGSSEFVNPLMSRHADSSSVEDRIKRNKHKILRTTADMDRGFSKR